MKVDLNDVSLPSIVFDAQHERVSDSSRCWLQILGLICKRYHVLRRQYIFLFGFLVLPLLIEILLVSIVPTPQQILSSLIPNDRVPGAQVTLLPSIYDSQTIVTYVNSDNNNIRTRLIESLQSSTTTIEEIFTDNVLNYVRERYLQTEENFINEYQIAFALYNNGTNVSPSLIIDSYFSTVNYHTMPTSLGVSTTNLFQFYANSSRKKIITTNQPIVTSSNLLPTTESFLQLLYCFDTIPLSLFNFLNSILGSIFLSILLVPIIHERIHHAKDLQLLTNLSKKIYWFANASFDFTLCVLLCVLLTIIVKVKDLISVQTRWLKNEFLARISIQCARAIRSTYLPPFHANGIFLSSISSLYRCFITIDLRLFIHLQIGIDWFSQFLHLQYYRLFSRHGLRVHIGFFSRTISHASVTDASFLSYE